MKRTFAVIGVAVSLILTLGSCSKELGTSVELSSSTTSLTVNALLPDYDEPTKGNQEKNNKIGWTDVDNIYVYDDIKCLGTLTAALKDANDRYAVLSGTITLSRASKLTLVATEGLAPDVYAKDALLTSGITFDLSGQSLEKDRAPFVVYAVIDNPSSTGTSRIITSFSFATSVINVSCTALKVGTAVNDVKLYNVNTVMTITPKADANPAITSGTEGTITRTGVEGGELGIPNDEGVLIFTVAVPEQDATKEDRKIHVSQSGWPSSASFTDEPLTKGTSYNTVTQLSGPYKTIGGHSGVRLWADGPYWATCNIGAENPDDYGYYYMWGSTQAYEYRDKKFYKAGTNTLMDEGGFAWGQYNEFGTYDESDAYNKGFTKYNSTDGKTQLEYIDDVAIIEWGCGWRMPTGGANGEFKKLWDNCIWTYKISDPQGCLVTGKDEYAGISVFFPAAGFGRNASRDLQTSVGDYWSSTLSPSSNPVKAYNMEFNCNSEFSPQAESFRYFGFSVRPVID